MCLSSFSGLSHNIEQALAGYVRKSICLVVCPQQNLNMGEGNSSTSSIPINKVVSDFTC